MAPSAKNARDPSTRAILPAEGLTDEEELEALYLALPLRLAQGKAAARAWLLKNLALLPASDALSLLADCATFDPELALSAAQQLGPELKSQALREVFNTWAIIAPEQAARAAAALPQGDGQAQAVGEVARVWAEQAPAEAEAWASALTTPEARRQALVPIVESWAVQDPKQAAAALPRVPDDGYKQQLVDTIAAEWVRTDPLEARGWVETLMPVALREAAAGALLASLLQSDAQRAANWALELGGSERSTLVENTLSTWIGRDPDAALSWLIRLPERSGRSALIVLATDRVRLQSGPGVEPWLMLRTRGRR